MRINTDIASYIKVNKSAANNKEPLQAIFDALPDGIQVLQAVRKDKRITDFTYLMTNEAAKQYTGHALGGATLLTQYPGDEVFFRRLTEVTESGAPQQWLHPLYINESVSWFNMKCVQFGDGVLLSHEEVSPQELILRGQEAEWQTLVDHTPDPVARFDHNLKIVFANRAFFSITGLCPEEVYGKDDLEIGTSPDIADPWMKLLRRVFELGVSTEMAAYYPFRDRQVFMVTRVVPEFGPDGSVRTLLVIGRDITEQQQWIEELKEREKQLQALLNHTPDQITRWDRQLKLIYANPAFEKKAGCDLISLLGRTPRENGEPEAAALPYMSKLQMAFRTGQPQQHAGMCHSEEKVRFQIIPETGADGAIQSVLSIGRDMKPLKEDDTIRALNRELLVKNRTLSFLNEELHTFHKIAANDYLETLRHLYTGLEFIISNDGDNLSHSGKASLRRAQSVIQKTKLLTDDILAYSNIQLQEHTGTPLDLNTVVQKAIHLLEEKITQSGTRITCASLPEIPGNADQLVLLFYHLLDNAIKFRKPGIDPVIHIKYEQATGIRETLSDTPYIIITVSDNGIGFHEDHTERIFDLFFRIHEKEYKGSGTGLAICKKIITLHEGFIIAESIPGQGAAFSCYLPV